MPDELKQVNISMPADVYEMLKTMVKDDDTDNSKLVRKLLRKEWEDRQALGIVGVGELPAPDGADRIRVEYRRIPRE